uniref:hypothetical protein n=1 Tax=Staphylococcus haemolyticus TaxID=1283 RepID=UPI001C5CB365
MNGSSDGGSSDLDETLGSGQDRRETLGRDHFIDVGRSRHVTIAKDLVETGGDVRIEKTATDRKAETGGPSQHKEAGQVTGAAGAATQPQTRRQPEAGGGWEARGSVRGPCHD